MPLDLINDDEVRPPNCEAPPLLAIEPFASPEDNDGCGGCCIGGKKVEAMAVVIVDGRVGGTRGLAAGFDDDEDVEDEDVLLSDFDAGT